MALKGQQEVGHGGPTHSGDQIDDSQWWTNEEVVEDVLDEREGRRRMCE